MYDILTQYKNGLVTWKDLRKAYCQNQSCIFNLEKGHVKQVDQNLGIRTSSKEIRGSWISLQTISDTCTKIGKRDKKNVIIGYDGQQVVVGGGGNRYSHLEDGYLTLVLYTQEHKYSAMGRIKLEFI